ncbi:MAG: tetratricopeptide repeat protein [Geminicoccaceae bacterium]
MLNRWSGYRAIIRKEREWNEEAARKQLVRFFQSLGPTHPQTLRSADAFVGAVLVMGDSIGSLPKRFPIFPLSGTVLLPRGNLPLNIFEPRYLAMVRDAMQTDQVIGMIQPKDPEDTAERPLLYRTGCVGRISNFQETDDGRFLITLGGICRFDVVEEFAVATPYRQIEADFSRWTGDFEPESPPDLMRAALLEALQGYFDQHDIEADWNAIRRTARGPHHLATGDDLPIPGERETGAARGCHARTRRDCSWR